MQFKDPGWPGRLQRVVRRRASLDESLAGRVRIDDYGLLAYLYFAVPERARALIDVEDGTCGGELSVDEEEAGRDRALAEQALAGTDHYGELPEAQGIDEGGLEQGLEECAASVDLDLAAFFGLYLRNLLCNLSLDHQGVVPLDLGECARGDDLGTGVEGRSTLISRVGGIGPRAGKDLIRLAAEEEGAGAQGPLGHDVAELLVELWD